MGLQSALYHACVHQPIPADKVRKKKWLVADSEQHQALTKVLNKKDLLEGVGKLTKFCHTSELEVCHGMMTKYAPKRQGYPYESMLVHTMLAALDHNNNMGRKQAHKKGGQLLYHVARPKQ